MTLSDNQLLDLLEKAKNDPRPENDISSLASDFTLEDAYRLQVQWKQRQADAGDPVIGYRVSMSTRSGLEESAALGIIPSESVSTISPIFATLSRSNLGTQDNVVEVAPDRYGYVEAEVGVLMASRLEGPNVTAAQALSAVAGYLPAIDLAQIQKSRPYGLVHTMATMAGAQDTTVIFGTHLTPPTVDMQLEGMLVSVDGEPRASATAWEAMGHPLETVAWLANALHAAGAALEPGQLIVTGVCPTPQRLLPGNQSARVDFATLGGVSVRVSVPE